MTKNTHRKLETLFRSNFFVHFCILYTYVACLLVIPSFYSIRFFTYLLCTTYIVSSLFAVSEIDTDHFHILKNPVDFRIQR